MADRAVSELLGFVLVFSLVAATVGAVSVVGFDRVTDARDTEALANTERAFDILADDLDTIHRGGAPVRVSRFDLDGGTLSLEDGPTLTVTITNGTAGTPSYSRPFDPVVFTAAGSDTRLVYANGAVMRGDGERMRMVRRPPMLFRTDGTTRIASLPILDTRSTVAQRATGDRTVRLRADHASTVLLNPDNVTGPTPYDLRVTLETTPLRAPVWEQYLDDSIAAAYGVTDPCRVEAGSQVVCTFTVDRLYVTVTHLDVRFTT